VYFGEISLSGAVRPVAQTASRLKEAQKLGFARAILPDAARAEGTSEPGLSLQSVGSLASLVADIAAQGKTDDRRQPSDDRRRKADDRGPTTDVRARKADAG
jgi:DNA repair protein RadA/Sms